MDIAGPGEETAGFLSGSGIIHAAERPGDVRHSRASAEKLRAAGWGPQSSLEEGLAATLAYFKAVQ